MVKDYIVVGSGLAGICFAETALNHGKTVLVIDGEKRSSSIVAGGMYNPVVLKRFTEVWNIATQIDVAKPFYEGLEAKLGATFNHKMPLLRRLLSVEEQNNWFHATDKPSLEPYLAPELTYRDVTGVKASFGFGEVYETGYLDSKGLILAYKNYLKERSLYLKEAFDFDAFSFTDTGVTYRDIKAQHIVFAEGFGIQNNPFFKDLPLDGTKGELLVVRIPDLNIDFILKANIFLIPIGNDLYKVGATYDWKDKSDTPTIEGKGALLKGLREVVGLDFEVVEHLAGVRPTVKDRKPLVGAANESERIHVLNGLGTRGVFLGPYLAQQLFNQIENGAILEDHISITRFKKYKK